MRLRRACGQGVRVDRRKASGEGNHDAGPERAAVGIGEVASGRRRGFAAAPPGLFAGEGLAHFLFPGLAAGAVDEGGVEGVEGEGLELAR
jgi:hypothetical protein